MRNIETLLERARHYDRAALGELYDQYAHPIYAYVFRRVGDAGLAEDLTGDVFVRVVRALRQHRPWHTTFQAWLYRIAHNVVVDHYRSRAPAPMVSFDEDWIADEEGDPARTTPDVLARLQLRSAISRLTPEQQAVLALRFGEGLTAREAAQILQKTPGAVDALQHRAVASLRRMLTETSRTSEKPLVPSLAS